MNRLFTIFGIVVAVMLGLAVLINYNKEPTAQSIEKNNTDGSIESSFSGIKTYFQSNEKYNFKLSSPQIKNKLGENIIENAQLAVINKENNQILYTLHARDYVSIGADFWTLNDAVINTSDATIFGTQLIYSTKDNIISTTSQVTYTTASLTILASSLTWNPSLEQLHIERRVQAIYVPQ